MNYKKPSMNAGLRAVRTTLIGITEHFNQLQEIEAILVGTLEY